MTSAKFGLTSPFQCGYLPNQQEQLLVYIDDRPMNAELYSILQHQGFRRSDSFVYQPKCENCNACTSIRLDIAKFNASKSQKRISNKTKHFQLTVSEEYQDHYFQLYERYVNKKHQGGVMHPAQIEQLLSFGKCDWLTIVFAELYDGDKLIAVAICDQLQDSLSAVYTFYDPDYEEYSLGTAMILKQIDLAKQRGLSWLHLGYYIESCAKMNYKAKFRPFQLLQKGRWTEYA